jgi:hypothetical protein
MSVRPVLLKDIRRTAIEQHQQSRGTGSYNSFSPLMPRERTFSYGKRRLSTGKNDETHSIDHASKVPRFDSSAVFEQLKGQETVLSEVKGMLDTMDVSTAIGDKAPEEVKRTFVGIEAALKLLLKSQENLTSVLVDAFKVKPSMDKVSNSQKNNTLPKENAKATATHVNKPEVTAARKVKQAIRDAEKKTLLFNLDLGKVPTMNKETLSRKVTLDLSSKASAGGHDYDIKDAEESIDDILSCSKLEFLGTTSKKYFNKRNLKDARNDTFCTMPVRMEFKDKDTRIQAEKTLRKICHVSCTVPYPKRLREVLDKLITEGKKKYPNSFIRTKVNVDDLTIDVHAKTDEGWQDLGLKCDIPLNICDSITTESIQSSQKETAAGEVMQIS